MQRNNQVGDDELHCLDVWWCPDEQQENLVTNRDPGAKRKRPRFDMYVLDVSYFSGKLEAYFRYKRIPFRRIEVTWAQWAKLGDNVGLMQVPLVFDRQLKLWLRDTTSIIELFEAKPQQYGISYPDRVVIPNRKAQAQFFGALLEEYADEWLWLPALYYRWGKKLDAGNLARIFQNADFLRDGSPLYLPKPIGEIAVIDRQYEEYVRQGGVVDAAGERYVEDVFENTLNCLEAHFSHMPFILGWRPTFADFGFMASMFRHFANDPTPAKYMRLKAPGVYEWVARMWNSATLDGSDNPCETGFPYTLEPILVNVCRVYLPYLIANARAVIEDLDECSVGPLRMKPLAFRAWTALNLVTQWEAIDNGEQLQILEYLNGLNLRVSFTEFLDAKKLFVRGAKLWTAGQSTPPVSFISSRLFLFLTLFHAAVLSKGWIWATSNIQ